MIIGGFKPVYGDDGGYQNQRTWIYNSTHWIETAPTKIARDRPACSIVNSPDGKVFNYNFHHKSTFSIALIPA